MRRSRPNLGLREAPPALLEIYDLAGRVEALLGETARPRAPGTCGRITSSARPAGRFPGLAFGELPGQALVLSVVQDTRSPRLLRLR